MPTRVQFNGKQRQVIGIDTGEGKGHDWENLVRYVIVGDGAGDRLALSEGHWMGNGQRPILGSL